MKQKNGKVTLVAKVLGGIIFLAVFIFNGMAIIESDSNGLSLSTLKAYAQSGGTGNEEEEVATGLGKKEVGLVQCGLKPFVKKVYYECLFNDVDITGTGCLSGIGMERGVELIEGGVVKSSYTGTYDYYVTTTGTTPSNLVQGWMCRYGGYNCLGVDVTGCNPCDGQVCSF